MNYILLLLFIAAAQDTNLEEHENGNVCEYGRVELMGCCCFIGSQNKRFKRVIRIDKNNDTEIKNNGTECFHYTWLATDDVQTFAPYLNKTCSDKFSKDKPYLRLCVDPMAVTNNTHEPDHAWLYENHKEALCTLQRGQACVKYTYRFNGDIQNITRYCSKVVVDDKPMESGCVVDYLGSVETEVCACKEDGFPCNGSSQLGFMSAGLMIIWILNLLT